MVQVPSKSLTLEEFLRLPETKPASEYIEEQILQKPMPQGKHSRIQGELLAAINAVVKPERVACAFPELRCTYPSRSHPADVYGGRSTVPDIAVFTWSRILCDDSGEVANAFSLAPDWTIEILSPDQSHTRVTKNIIDLIGNSIDTLQKRFLLSRL
nr:Uma2 family endonuclease [Acaryochloris sp. CCMEE 5410]